MFKNLILALALSLALFGSLSLDSASASAALAAPLVESAPYFEPKVITLPDQSRLHAEIHRGQPGKATFVLVNGLVYDIARWNPVADALAARGYTVVRYAFVGQPESLRLLAKDESPRFMQKGLELKDLSEELTQVLEQLGITERIHLVGLSFGATAAAEYASTHQDRVEATILISPMVVPLDFYDAGGRSIRAWLNTVRYWEDTPCDLYGKINPFLCLARDYWYDSFYAYIYQNYLATRVKTTPEGLDPSTYKKSIFHLVRATRDFDLRSYASRMTNVHFMIASQDEAHLKTDQLKVWNEVSPEERRSLTTFEGAKHAIPDEAPGRTADLLSSIAEKTPELQSGQQWQVPADR
jgi:pimeloyl-ACP methyl ester carboxylesterase